MAEAIVAAKAEDDQRKASGFDQTALDEAARQGFANGAFEESEEDRAAVIEEFYPEITGDNLAGITATTGIKVGLAEKLNMKASQLSGAGG